MTRKNFLLLPFIPLIKKILPKKKLGNILNKSVKYIKPCAIDNGSVSGFDMKILFSYDGENWIECDDMELLFGTGRHEPEGFIKIGGLK